MKVRPRVHLIHSTDGNWTACGRRRRDTLHADSLAAVTCWNCKVTMRARELREAARQSDRDAEARS